MDTIQLTPEVLAEVRQILTEDGIVLVEDKSFTEFYLFERSNAEQDSIAALIIESRSQVLGQYNGLCQGFLFDKATAVVKNENNSNFIEANANGLAFVIREVIYYNENPPTNLLMKITRG